MHKIKYQIKTLSPILLSTNTGDMNMTATCDYIPGSAILGALAARYIQIKKLGEKAHTDNNFYNWFLNSKIIFGNAYPCQKDEYGTKNYHPVPLCLQREKNREDRAIDLFLRTPDPKEQMKRIGGYGYIAEDTIQQLAPAKSLNFHHSRPDRIKGHSSEGEIFNYESINPEQLFEGEIIGEKTDLEEFVKLIGNKFFIRLGRSRTAQYGRAELELLNTIEEVVQSPLSDEIYLVFCSPTILYNENGFPDTSLVTLARYLSEALEIEIDPKQIEAFKETVEIENFNSAWRLKRPSEIAFTAGSCFLIQASKWNETKMVEILKKGIGERRGEGFGMIQLKWWQENTFKVKQSEKTKIEKPEGKMPELTSMIFKEVIKENLNKAIERDALERERYEEFTKHNPPTNSLLSRLEMMLGDAKDKEQFLGQMCSLRKTARDKLEACRGTNITLLEFIEKGNPDFQQVFEQNQMEEEIEYDPAKDTEFCNEMYKLYWLTFLRMMRKSRDKGATNE